MTMLATPFFEQYCARQTANNSPIVFDQMIFAKIDGLTADNLAHHLEMPNANQIAYRADITRAGYIDENKVVYSVMLGSNVGDFEFNFIGLINKAENKLAVALFTDLLTKRKSKGKTYGNAMTRNLILNFRGAKALTDITIPAESWQLDFTGDLLQIRQDFENLKLGLGRADGFRFIGQCESIAELRTIEPTEDQQRILVKSWHAGANKGGGTFYADLADTTSPDNGGTVIVTAGGKRWKRVGECLKPYDFGEREYKNDEVAFTNGITRIFGGGKLPKNYRKRIDGFNVEESVVAIGRGALANATSAGQSIAIGGNALNQAVNSYSNIAIGETALEKLQSSGSVYNEGHQGSRNVAIGGNALQFLKNGTANIAIGRNTACGMEYASECVVIGSGAMSGLNVNGWQKDVESMLGNKNPNARVTAVGAEAMQYFNGYQAVAFGYKAGKNIKVGNANTLIGHQAGMSLENLVGWDGYVKTVYGVDSQGLSVSYTKRGNSITLNLDNHTCEQGSTAFIRWDSGPALPRPLHGHPWRQEIVAVTRNTFTVYCPYEGDGNGRATLYWSLSKRLEPQANTSYHNTIVGHHGAIFADKSIASTVVGSMNVQASGAELLNATIIGYRNLGKATRIKNAIIIGAELMKEDTVAENILNIGGGLRGNLATQKYGVNTDDCLADFHIKSKGDAGSGTTTKKEGVLIEHSGIAKYALSGGGGANIDMYQGDTFKGGFRYSYNQGLMTVVMNGQSSWRFLDDHTFSPATNTNSIGTSTNRVKEIFVNTPPKEDYADKVATTKWVKNLFSKSLGQTGWSISPSGEIEQWGQIDMPSGSNSVTVAFPIAFNECFFCIPIDISGSGQVVPMSTTSVSSTKATIKGERYAGTIKWFAKGR